MDTPRWQCWINPTNFFHTVLQGFKHANHKPVTGLTVDARVARGCSPHACSTLTPVIISVATMPAKPSMASLYKLRNTTAMQSSSNFVRSHMYRYEMSTSRYVRMTMAIMPA